MTFIYNKNLNYTLSLPGSISKNKLSIQSQKGDKWLDIKFGPINDDGYNYYLITDYNTNSSIKTTECKPVIGCAIYLVAPSQLYKSATGNFISGCPP